MIGLVASFTDAWIETSIVIAVYIINVSHLLQMRGLKHHEQHQHKANQSRIFYRCVD